ncbi:hypothetical protein RJ639_006032 [Escallonia herrerae]|uniref:Uncharacterized protein n=1 Tax=Escallonia herrerae TaxID=1293975 RepID=A0AA89ATF6_9ASTE|nr:hypothetical protein RJ639_006032 [Escallonia herrerae]
MDLKEGQEVKAIQKNWGQKVEVVQKGKGRWAEVVQKVKGQWAELVQKRKQEHELTQVVQPAQEISEFVFDPAKWPRVQMDVDFLQLSMIFNTTKSVVQVPNLGPKFKIAVLASKQESSQGNLDLRASNSKDYPTLSATILLSRPQQGKLTVTADLIFEDLISEVIDMEHVLHYSGCQELDRLENSSRTIKDAKIIGQDNEALSVILLPLKKWCKGPKIHAAAGAISSAGLLDEISCELLGFTASVVHIKTSYGYELMAKSFSVLKKLTDNYRVSRSSYFGHRVGLVELYSLSHSLLRLDIRDHDHRSLVGTGSTEVVDAVIEAFLRSKDRLNIYGCTIDDKVCEHPKEWRPERFLDENKDSVDPYKMTAFGRGKRVSINHSIASPSPTFLTISTQDWSHMLKHYQNDNEPIDYCNYVVLDGRMVAS